MTRVGWIFLTLVVLAGAAFASMTRFGGPWPASTSARTAGKPSGPRVVDHLEEVVRARLARLRGDPGGGAAALVVPVQGVARGAIVDTWGQARGQERQHHGTDIPAPGGTPVLAAADGTIEKLFASERGGTTVYQRSRGGGWIYYYAHLSGYAAGLHEGQRVRAGETIAYVGDTGDAGPGNTHLHFGLVRSAPGQRWYEGEDVNAYPLLAAGPPRR